MDIFDLNDEMNRFYRMPKITQSEKIYGLLCCKRPPLKIEFGTVGKTAFLPGESISFYAKLTNSSGRKLTSLRVILMRTIKYNVNKMNKKSFLKNLAKINYKFQTDPATEFTWNEGKIVVPEYCLPSQEKASRLIQVIYDLRLIVFSTLFTIRSTTILPIRVGNVPIRQVAPDSGEASSSASIESPVRPYYDIASVDEVFINKIIKI